MASGSLSQDRPTTRSPSRGTSRTDCCSFGWSSYSSPPTAIARPAFTAFPRTRPGESANAVPHYHKLCSRVSHIWGNRRGQHIRSAMDKPRPGKTTFVIMVSPLPGKYELPAGRPTATSYALHCTHTLTFLPASPSLLGPSTQRIHVLSSKNSSVLSHATGDHIVFKRQMTDQQPLRSDIYIRHAPP